MLLQLSSEDILSQCWWCFNNKLWKILTKTCSDWMWTQWQPGDEGVMRGNTHPLLLLVTSLSLCCLPLTDTNPRRAGRGRDGPRRGHRVAVHGLHNVLRHSAFRCCGTSPPGGTQRELHPAKQRWFVSHSPPASRVSPSSSGPLPKAREL